MALANVLVGNAIDQPALEFAGDRLSLVADSDCLVSVVGAEVTDPRFPGRVSLASGERLDLTLTGLGLRIVVATTGGSRTGGIEVAVGDTIDAAPGQPHASFRLAASLDWVGQTEIRFVPDIETSDVVELTVSGQVNRQGLRLHGAINGWPGLEFSEPSVIGMIQVTPDGTVLIHGPDGPTIGGYGRLGAVISADIPALSQLRPGNAIQLTPVSLEHARRVFAEAQEKLAHRLTQLRLATGLMK